MCRLAVVQLTMQDWSPLGTVEPLYGLCLEHFTHRNSKTNLSKWFHLFLFSLNWTKRFGFYAGCVLFPFCAAHCECFKDCSKLKCLIGAKAQCVHAGTASQALIQTHKLSWEVHQHPLERVGTLFVFPFTHLVHIYAREIYLKSPQTTATYQYIEENICNWHELFSSVTQNADVFTAQGFNRQAIVIYGAKYLLCAFGYGVF